MPSAALRSDVQGFSTDRFSTDRFSIDRDHLSRMTLGDRSLQREVLGLFDRQSAILLERMQGPDRAKAAAAAHTMKGSARGIGAFGLAQAAEAMESADPAQQAKAVARLSALVDEARRDIARLLQIG